MLYTVFVDLLQCSNSHCQHTFVFLKKALMIINQSASIKIKEHVFWTGLKKLIHHPLYIYQQLTTFTFKFQIPNRLSF